MPVPAEIYSTHALRVDERTDRLLKWQHDGSLQPESGACEIAGARSVLLGIRALLARRSPACCSTCSPQWRAKTTTIVAAGRLKGRPRRRPKVDTRDASRTVARNAWHCLPAEGRQELERHTGGYRPELRYHCTDRQAAGQGRLSPPEITQKTYYRSGGQGSARAVPDLAS